MSKWVSEWVKDWVSESEWASEYHAMCLMAEVEQRIVVVGRRLYFIWWGTPMKDDCLRHHAQFNDAISIVFKWQDWDSNPGVNGKKADTLAARPLRHLFATTHQSKQNRLSHNSITMERDIGLVRALAL